MADKYMAFVGSYSYTGKAKGITAFDVDVEKGIFKKRCEVEVNNSSYVIASRDCKTLYSIADEGVVTFHIMPNGSLHKLGTTGIRGMRGCHLCTNITDEYIMVSGYHDGKSTLLKLAKDGHIEGIVDGVYDKGFGSVAERNFRPHVTSTRMTDDGKYVMVCDEGIDQVRIYRFDRNEGKMRQVDAIRCDLESGPRMLRFSPDRKFIYLMYELKNVIDVFSYEPGDKIPKIEKIQTISTTTDQTGNKLIAACAMRFSPDREAKYLYCTNAGENTVTIFERDLETGILTLKSSLPISGEYPKDICIFPDLEHIAVANHESGTITFFKVDYEKGLLVMCGREVEVNEPNCIVLVKLPQE